MEMLGEVELSDYEEPDEVKIEMEEHKNEEKRELFPEEEKELDQIIADLRKKTSLSSFTVIEFEKDDDENYHIDFIHSAAMLKARNYRIQEVDQLTTKIKAGNIIPALATTTAMIVGTVCIEMLKLV